jgi:hypothetical protein
MVAGSPWDGRTVVVAIRVMLGHRQWHLPIMIAPAAGRNPGRAKRQGATQDHAILEHDAHARADRVQRVRVVERRSPRTLGTPAGDARDDGFGEKPGKNVGFERFLAFIPETPLL